MPEKMEAGCSRECQYLFHECEADGTPGSECRTHFNHCVEECNDAWRAQTGAPHEDQ
jgi:hypothetical protein